MSQIRIEKFQVENKKDEINPYMIGKILRKKYEGLGYKIIQAQDFETSLLIDFIRKYRFLDKYSKVKLGEYKKSQKTLDYNKELVNILGWDNIEKLLFICRICSYLGDPSFPDFIISGKGETELRYVYTGDELIRNKIFFSILSESFGVKVKFCSVDFSDFKQRGALDIDPLKLLEEVNLSVSSRVNFESSVEDTGINFNFIKKWLGEKSTDPEDVIRAYDLFKKNLLKENKLTDLLGKLVSSGKADELIGKQKPEQLLVVRNILGVNMMEAHDVINLYEITK